MVQTWGARLELGHVRIAGLVISLYLPVDYSDTVSRGGLSKPVQGGTFSSLMRKGIPVSPGVAVGTAFCIHEIFVNPDTKRLEDNEITAELAKYETARDKAAGELRALQTKVEQQVGHDEAAIFAAHEDILRDV